MKTPFYHTNERQATLLQEARSWLGTPFSENCAIKGPQGGVDCVNFIAATHTAAGACGAVTLPVLPVEQVRAWHVHNPESKILDWLGRPEVRGRVRVIEPDEPRLIGDLVILKLNLTEHHLTLFCGHELLHVAIPAGVVAHSAQDPDLLKLVRCTYRIYGEP